MCYAYIRQSAESGSGLQRRERLPFSFFPDSSHYYSHYWIIRTQSGPAEKFGLSNSSDYPKFLLVTILKKAVSWHPLARSVLILATTGLTYGSTWKLSDLELKDHNEKTLNIQYNRSIKESWMDIECSQANINVNGMLLLNLAKSSVIFLKRLGSWVHQRQKPDPAFGLTETVESKHKFNAVSSFSARNAERAKHDFACVDSLSVLSFYARDFSFSRMTVAEQMSRFREPRSSDERQVLRFGVRMRDKFLGLGFG